MCAGFLDYYKQFKKIELVYYEKFNKRYQAKKREAQLKKWGVAKKKALITGNLELLKKLSKGIGLVDELE